MSMYTRYRIHSFNISYKPTCAMTESSQFMMGIMVGPKKTIKDGDIMKMRPCRAIPAWKTASMQLGRSIDSQRFMYCWDSASTTATEDEVAATLYYKAATADKGYIQVTYDIEFAYPRPF